MQDCFIQLDKILPEKDRTEIKNLKSRDETIKYHHGLGVWLRNNWGLWGGSRLQKYFLDKNTCERHIEAFFPSKCFTFLLHCIFEFFGLWSNEKHNLQFISP